MAQIFRTVRAQKPKHNAFPLPHEVKLSMNMGDLVPVLCKEVVPGDRFSLKTLSLIRFAPLVSPVMHSINAYCHSFFVPSRLLWNDWETFITGGPDGKSNPVFPKIPTIDPNVDYFKSGTLADYLGVPDLSGKVPSAGDSPEAYINSLPFRAYQLIYNEYYRDENLIPELNIPRTSGVEAESDWPTLLTLRKRAWEKDYFTSALPWAQKGDPVSVPIGDRIPVYSDPNAISPYNAPKWGYSGATAPVTSSSAYAIGGTGPGTSDANDVVVGGPAGFDVAASREIRYYDPNGSMFADLQEATTITINDLRTSYRLQRWLERNARGGSRYIEQILSHFGVKSSDARLQRPEFLGGARNPVHFSEVLQTSQSEQTPQANMAGHGVAGGVTREFDRFFEEHGYVITILSVLPRTAYQQGLPRVFRKFDKYDYFWPEFAHLGEQPIYNSEIYFDPMLGSNDETFGYTPRYAEYKYEPSSVHGDFRGNLSYWHAGRIFDQRPALNEEFVSADPTTRIFAVEDPDVQKLYVELYHDLKAIRPMPKYGTPSW